MRTEDIISVVLIVPTISSVCMWAALLLDRHLLYDNSLVGLILSLWGAGALSSVGGLVCSFFLARRHSAPDIGVLGLISCIGILANILGVLIVLGAATAI
jgi:hypothetical protein